MLLDKFWWFLEERHAIYLRRASGAPPPWTDDPVLRDYRFCNVYRELDTVTVWIRKNISEEFQDKDALPTMLAIARQFNYIPMLHEFVGLWREIGFCCTTHGRYMSKINARKEANLRMFNSAYMITGANVPLGWTKAKHVLYNVCLPLAEDDEFLELAYGDSLEAFCDYLRRKPGWGWFLAYEVACDLRHTVGWLDNAEDINTWANPGPGARRGLNRLHGRDLNETLPRQQCIHEMRQLLHNKPDPNRELELRDIEHTLCEFDKWLRGGGKRRFKPTARKEEA